MSDRVLVLVPMTFNRIESQGLLMFLILALDFVFFLPSSALIALHWTLASHQARMLLSYLPIGLYEASKIKLSSHRAIQLDS